MKRSKVRQTHATGLLNGLADAGGVLERRVVAEEQVLRFLMAVQDKLDETGMSQAELARRIGAPRSQVNRWLRDESGLNAKSMFLLAAGLGFDLELEWIPAEPQLRAVPDEADAVD